MLTGMMAPSEGYATVAGKDIRTDMGAIRQEIGICLQHDCLFPELTVREHVQFFARLKGMYARMSYEEAEAKVDLSIQDVALSEKRNTMSKALSGGMKRKLSVAIAFCGDSKTVLLDEPTSGMVRTLTGVCVELSTSTHFVFFDSNIFWIVFDSFFRTPFPEGLPGTSSVNIDRIVALF